MSDTHDVATACVDEARTAALLRGCIAEFPQVRFTVTGACMAPALLPGDVALVEAARQRRPRLGEIVLVRLAEGLRLHRLVPGPRRRGSFQRTKADRAACWDPPFVAEDLLGAVVAVERAGRVLPAPRRLAPTLRSLALPARSWLGLGLSRGPER
jgi:hypothetical protein